MRLVPAHRAEHRLLRRRAHVDHGDENFAGGEYYETGRRPDVGLAVARMLAHLTYVSEQLTRGEVRPAASSGERDPGFGIDFEVESYLDHQASSFLDRFDANSYLYLSRVMDYFDPFADADAVRERLRHASTRSLVLSFDTDWRFPTRHSSRSPDARVGRCAGVAPGDRLAARPRLVPAAGPEYHEAVKAFLET